MLPLSGSLVERIALHQTRLHTPGLSLDARGIALGSRGLVLFPSVDRFVGFLAAYTRDHSLEGLLHGLSLNVVRSDVGAIEMALEVAAESSDRMDRIADTARLVDGLTFTGTTRHFVQYRDAAGPFGYDATSLLASDAPLTLYHDRFTQTYGVDRPVDLRSLLLRLMLRADGAAAAEGGSRILVAEQGLGPALIHYLVRSRVQGEVCVAEWPSPSALDEDPVRRWILRVADPPGRMRRLLQTTPGIVSFVPSGPGIAVETGFRHPIELRACPLFDPAGLVLLRGRGDEPWVIDRLAPMGELTALARVALRPSEVISPAGRSMPVTEPVSVPLRLAPSSRPLRNVTATWVATEHLPLLRRLAYALPHVTIAATEIALTPRGAALRCALGIDAIPLGTFYVELYPRLYVPAGYDVAPDVAPDVLARALGVSGGQHVFIGVDGRAVALDHSAFVPLEAALLDAPAWEPLEAHALAHPWTDEPIELTVGSIGLMPLRGVQTARGPQDPQER